MNAVNSLNAIALALLVIGGLNWGLVGLFGIDLVASLFGGTVGPRSPLSNFVYVAVGLAAIYTAVTFRWGSMTPHRD